MLPWVAAAAVASALVLHGYGLGHCPQDDAFISFRYAKNLIDGHGLVFNQGERVEGYTNFLWTLAMAPLLAAGADGVEGARALGCLFAAATVFLLARAGAVGGAGAAPARGSADAPALPAPAPENRTLAGKGTGDASSPPAPAPENPTLAGRRTADAPVPPAPTAENRTLAGVGPAAAAARWGGLLAGLFLAASSFFAAEAVQGLETVLFAFIVTALLLRAEREAERGGSGVIPGVLGGLAALTRPEGLIVLAGTAAHRMLPAPLGPAPGRPRRDRIVPAARSLLVGLAIALPHRLAAWAYYGQALPNTFYAKVGGGWEAIARGAAYAGEFLIAWLPALALALLGLAALPAWKRSLRGGFILLYVLYVIAVGGDYKWTLRFFVPVMPMAALLAGVGALWLASQAASRAGRAAIAAALACGLVAAQFAFSFAARDFSRIRRERYAMDRAAGRWFARNVPAGTLLATSNAGIIPYFSGLPTLDMLGLTDAHISRVRMPGMGSGVAGHEKGDGAYVFARKPGIILFMQSRLSTEGPLPLEEALRRINFVAEAQLLQQPGFLEEYEWTSAAVPGYTLNFFRRRDEASAVAPAPPPAPPLSPS